jgi:hypothetical protein
LRQVEISGIIVREAGEPYAAILSQAAIWSSVRCHSEEGAPAVCHEGRSCRRIPNSWPARERKSMIRKISSGQYRLYSRKVNPKTGKRRNLGTFKSRAAAEKHERAVQYFKRH